MRCRKDFLEVLDNRGYQTHIIAGNHDEYYKDTYKINALEELVGDRYEYITTHSTPYTLNISACEILLMPWITKDNEQQAFDAINNSKAPILMGHLELEGFEFYKGQVSDHGQSSSIFSRFVNVYSGHYHHRSSRNNIHYLGAFSEHIWSDYNDPKGFHIFDTETRALTFIRNPYTIFEKIWYNDTDYTIEDIASRDYEKYKNKIIKVIVQNKTNPYWFDMFVDNLEKSGILELQVVEDHLNLNLEQDEDIVNEAEDTLSIFKTYINQINTSDDIKKKIENTVHSLYNEALSVE
jgi:DNA repair exonuclease SbcCD nuclease subunit